MKNTEEANNEITKTIMSYIDLYKELEEEQVGGEFREKSILQEVRCKSRWKSDIGIWECNCYMQSWSCLRKVCKESFNN